MEIIFGLIIGIAIFALLLDALIDATRWLLGWIFVPDVMEKNGLERIREKEEETEKRLVEKEIAEKNHAERIEKYKRARANQEQKRQQEARERQLQGDRNAAAFEAERDAKTAEYRRRRQKTNGH